MFDGSQGLATTELAGWVAKLGRLAAEVDDAERIDQIRLLEELKAAASGAQARVTAAFAASQRAAQAAMGVAAPRRGLGVGAQVALARRDSPDRGGKQVGFAEALVHEMPQTLAALQSGVIGEWRATVLVRETACLSRPHRAMVDAELGPRLAEWGDRQVQREARKAAYRLDPGSVLARVRGAESDRRVTIRPAPDTMCLVTGHLPVAQGVAVHVALARAADSLKARGDARSRGQLMADEFVCRLTGQARPVDVPVEIGLVMTERALLGTDDTPASVDGYGPIPAVLARRIVASSQAQTWTRRLYARPVDGALVAMDSHRRIYPAQLRRLLVHRDQLCRTPWCNAPIRHADHATAAATGGQTTAANGQGLCAACNYAKQAPGWTTQATETYDTKDLAAPLLQITTPTRHRYTSRPPPLPGFPTSDPRTPEHHHWRRDLAGID